MTQRAVRVQHMIAGRCLVLTALLLASAPCLGTVSFQNATLGEAFERIAQDADLEYVICGDTPRQTGISLSGETADELAQSAVLAFPCRWTRMGNLFIVDAQPPGPPTSDVILTFMQEISPVGVFPDPLPQDPKAPLVADLWELWAAMHQDRFPAPTGYVEYIPFVAKPEDELGGRLCRDSYVQIALAAASASTAGPPEDAWLTLATPVEPVYALQLNWVAGTSLQKIGLGPQIPQRRAEELLQTSHVARMIEAYLLPAAIHKAAALGMPMMSESISLQAHTDLMGVADRLSGAAAPVRATGDAAAIEVRLCLRQRPRWAALTLILCASGVAWGPRDVADAYVMASDESSLADRVLRALSPGERLAWEGLRANRAIAELLWAVLSREQLGQLRRGERLAVSDFVSEPVAAAVYEAAVTQQFAVHHVQMTASNAATDRIWERFGGACGTFVLDDVCVAANRYDASGSRYSPCHTVSVEDVTKPSVVRETRHVPWRPTGNPPAYHRPYDRAVRDGRSDGRRSPLADSPRLLGEAPDPLEGSGEHMIR